MVPGEPDWAWNALLLEYAGGDMLAYRNGDFRNVADLDKARVQAARACFVLADRTSHDTMGQVRPRM
ncbi:unnamed protein product, partial [Phaeothamnion confervicola]